MQQRFAILARTEHMKETTQLGHLNWEEQCEIIKFEPTLEPAFKQSEDGKPIRDEEGDLLPDEFDDHDWITELDVDNRIIEHEDGMILETHRLDSRYVASVFNRMYKKHNPDEVSFTDDKLGWTLKAMIGFGRVFGAKGVNGAKAAHRRMKTFGRGGMMGVRGFGSWVSEHKTRILGSVAIGVLIIMFSQYIKFGLDWLFTILLWG
jgi:hypothetical protein